MPLLARRYAKQQHPQTCSTGFDAIIVKRSLLRVLYTFFHPDYTVGYGISP